MPDRSSSLLHSGRVRNSAVAPRLTGNGKSGCLGDDEDVNQHQKLSEHGQTRSQLAKTMRLH